MTQTTAIKLNNSVTTFTRIPLAFLSDDFAGGKLPNTQIELLGCIHTLNSMVNGVAEITYHTFYERLRLRTSVVWKGIKELVRKGVLTVVGKSRYKIAKKYNASEYIVLDDYLTYQEFNVKDVKNRKKGARDVSDKVKRLSRSALILLNYLTGYYRSEKFKATRELYKSSEIRLAKKLNMTTSSVHDALYELMKAGLVYRHVWVNGMKREGKGLNGSALSVYEVNSLLTRVKHQGDNKKPAAAATDLTAEQARRAKIERFEVRLEKKRRYNRKLDAQLKAIANTKADMLKAMLARDEDESARLEAQLKGLNAQLVWLLGSIGIPRPQIPKGYLYSDDEN